MKIPCDNCKLITHNKDDEIYFCDDPKECPAYVHNPSPEYSKRWVKKEEDAKIREKVYAYKQGLKGCEFSCYEGWDDENGEFRVSISLWDNANNTRRGLTIRMPVDVLEIIKEGCCASVYKIAHVDTKQDS